MDGGKAKCEVNLCMILDREYLIVNHQSWERVMGISSSKNIWATNVRNKQILFGCPVWLDYDDGTISHPVKMRPVLQNLKKRPRQGPQAFWQNSGLQWLLMLK